MNSVLQNLCYLAKFGRVSHRGPQERGGERPNVDYWLSGGIFFSS